MFFLLHCSEGESQINFNFGLEDGHLTSDFKSDVKFYPPMNVEMKLDVKHSRTDTGLTHDASLELSCSEGTKKFTWNAGSNSNMCETGFTMAVNNKDEITYTHKVIVISYS